MRMFIPFLYSRKFGDDPDFTLDGSSKKEWSKLEILKYLLAFAMSWTGDYICLNLDSNEIYYYYRRGWDDSLSTEENFKKKSKLIAPSFSIFIEGLEFADEKVNPELISKKTKKKDSPFLLINKPDKRLSDNEFKLIEQNLDVKLPANLVKFHKENNGGYPNKTIFYDYYGVLDFIEIKKFIPFLHDYQFEDNPNFTIDGISKKGWGELKIPKHFLPFAVDWGGNYVCLSLHDNKVYYYVRDVWSENISIEKNLEINSKLIAPSFTYFIKHLELPEEDND
ncbi:hypothetical protein EYW98_16730 [Escherichia coli]|nr:hypothetical protein [Escherichia coli]